MGKLLLEMALFAGILCQIAMLARVDGGGGDGRIFSPSALAATGSVYAAMYSGRSYSMDPSQVEPAQSNTVILEEIAQKEAQRIIETGDYESFRQRLESNRPTLAAAGVNF